MEESFIPLVRQICRSSSQGDRLGSLFSCLVDYFELEAVPERGPAGLAAVPELGERKVREIVVVQEFFDEMFR